jgi:hypothetical protein
MHNYKDQKQKKLDRVAHSFKNAARAVLPITTIILNALQVSGFDVGCKQELNSSVTSCDKARRGGKIH